MSTLVVCVDREGGLTDEPVVGWEAVRALVTDVGIDDPSDSRVNSLLEALKVARDLRDENEAVEVAVVSGSGDAVRADRAVARGVDEIVERYDPESAVVVVCWPPEPSPEQPAISPPTSTPAPLFRYVRLSISRTANAQEYNKVSSGTRTSTHRRARQPSVGLLSSG